MEEEQKETGKSKRRPRFLRKLLSILIYILIGALLCCMVLYLVQNSNKEKVASTILHVDNTIEAEDQLITVSTVEEIIKPAGELVTLKYYYKDADSSEDSKKFLNVKMPFTTNKVVFTYEGVASIGIDFLKVKIIGVDTQNQKITIKLPKVEILSNEIDMDSFEVPYEKTSIFNDTDMEDYTELIAKLKEEKKEDLESNTELLEQAKQNAETVIRQFLKSSDLSKEYTIVFQE